MLQWTFQQARKKDQSVFDQLLEIFQELLLITAGDVQQALDWLGQIDLEYGLSQASYGLSDFMQELEDKGYLERQNSSKQNPQTPEWKPSDKMGLSIRRKALRDIFGPLKKGRLGQHSTRYLGQGGDQEAETRAYEFGDPLEQIALTQSLENAYRRQGINELNLQQDDLRVRETRYQTQMATVLMIDISHSMILYGEDRITPAKRVALALSEYIQTHFPKDSLDIIVFGNDAWPVSLKDLPYLEVGPYHTNTVAGLELALNILGRRRHHNKQIFMITDGKPTCIKRGKEYYKNSFGLDRQILRRTLTLARHCRKLQIPITTFMIAQDPYLVSFVQEFTEVNQGKAFYSSLKGLGHLVFEDYKKRKTR